MKLVDKNIPFVKTLNFSNRGTCVIEYTFSNILKSCDSMFNYGDLITEIEWIDVDTRYANSMRYMFNYC